MVFAYRLKDGGSKEKGRSVEGFVIRHTWQFTSDPRAALLKKWDTVSVLEAKDIATLKKDVGDYDEKQKIEAAEMRRSDETSQTDFSGGPSIGSDDPLYADLKDKTLLDLKEFAKSHGFDEAEYSRLTRTKLIEYIILGMRERENA
jgi:hypothetical protein